MTKPLIPREQIQAEHATLSFLAWTRFYHLYDEVPTLMHNIPFGLYFETQTKPNLESLSSEIMKAIKSSSPIEIITIQKLELEKRFSKFEDKLSFLKHYECQDIKCIKFEDDIDYILEKHTTDKSRLHLFELHQYLNGFAITFPTLTSPNVVPEWKPFRGDLFDSNPDLPLIYEKPKPADNHAEQLEKLADKIITSGKKVLTVAGPSSSNKTTFAQRLAHVLTQKGHKTLMIEMDSFFNNVADIPYESDGTQDWESIKALNVDALIDRVNRLVAGEVVPGRRFLWDKGISIDVPEVQWKLEEFLILDGIHGLNEQLISKIGSVAPIFVCETEPVRIDKSHVISSFDARLIRRITRDAFFRAYPARSTLRCWTMVRMGEERNIFPYADNALFCFNSRMDYEIGTFAVKSAELVDGAKVAEADESEEEKKEIDEDIERIELYFSLTPKVNVEEIAPNSCVREFVGGLKISH